MNLNLIRRDPIGQAVFGTLTVDGQMPCFTLERLEVQIPTGTYPIEMTFSPRFQRMLPLLDQTEPRTDIRIHVGNWPRDTDGCILVGLGLGDNMITQSLAALDPLVIQIQQAVERGEQVTLTIS
jgi:Family of unknown function (DUF5675)